MQKAGESNLRFNTRRLWNMVRLLLKNRMSVIGLLFLVVSAGAAGAAFVLYPLNPQQHPTGGSEVPPEWMSVFPEGYYLSRNMVVGSNPTFSAPSALQEWSYSYDTASQPYLSVSWSSISATPGGGSLLVSSTSNSSLSMSIQKPFYYPYHGPPADFIVSGFEVQGHGLNSAAPILLHLFLERGTEKTYTLWNTTVSKNDLWSTSQYIIQGSSSDLTHTTSQNVQHEITFSEDVFSKVSDYTLGVSLVFPASHCSTSSPCSISITNLNLQLLGTSFGILGTDFFGGDLFGQLLWGARVSLFVGLVAAGIGIILGLIVGLIAGYKTGAVDETLMRFTDAMLVLPALPLLLVLITVLGPSLLNIIILIGFLGWMGFARVIRSQVLSLKERPFIEAARASGAGTGRILTSHIFPNVVSLTYVNLALSVPGAILTEAALSFLGLGDPQTISWGQILQRVNELGAYQIWWWVVPPGIAIAIVSLSFVLIGYALDEIFNPKLRKRR